ncbi:MAG: hypothetical protein IPI46_13790 [Bacteroidetes bacterium]|nr:hypothetical protein [Bacteroidota bacterium]
MENIQQYQTGFNTGYLITKHNPTLMNTIFATLSPNNSYTEGMIDGKQELEFEQVKDQIKEVDDLRNSTNERENDLGRE